MVERNDEIRVRVAEEKTEIVKRRVSRNPSQRRAGGLPLRHRLECHGDHPQDRDQRDEKRGEDRRIAEGFEGAAAIHGVSAR
jgi:hypothetical protein